MNMMGGIEMMVFDLRWDGERGRYMLRILHVTPHEAVQVVIHPAVDCTLPRLYLPKKLRMECWLRVQYAHSVRSVNQVLDWIEEELFAKGYRVLWHPNTMYSALAPDGQCLTTEREQSNCWTKCYQHNANKKQAQELEDLRRQNDILSYKVHRYEIFLKEQGYNIIGETIITCEDEEQP